MKVLKWPGTKWSIAGEIVSLMPEHKIYLEPFFGSGAVFFSKKPCNTEILNDLDSEVYNLFKCIRDFPEEMSQLILFTPYSREEYKKSYYRTGTNLEKARQFLIRSNMARAGMQYYSSSWRHAGPALGGKSYQRVSGEWSKLPENIIEASKRLKDAEIECTNAIDLIKKYNRSDCLLYVDPPYLLSTRKQRYYNVEMTDEKDHTELLEVLKCHKGPVLLSGYDSELYKDMLRDWNFTEFETKAEQGKKRVEIIWTNFSQNKQISMFG